MLDNEPTRRSEPRKIVDEYYSVEFSVSGVELSYQFKIWNMSTRGVCLVVRPDSDLLRHIKVGDTIHMKYYKSDASKPSEFIWTQIKHITKDEAGKFKNHYLIGLSVEEN
jgi:hypothetical protein